MANKFRHIASSSARLLAFGFLLSYSCATPANAQGEPFAGKNISVIIGFGPGGGYDMWGRIRSEEHTSELQSQR